MTTPYAAASVATPTAQLSQFGPLNSSNIAQAVAAAAGKQIEGNNLSL